MTKTLSAPWFQIAVVPLFLMMIGMFARRLARRDGDNSPARNDFAIGTTIILLLFGIAVGDVGRATPAELAGLLVLLVIIAVVLFASLEHDRYRSWERDNQGLPTNKKGIFLGVVAPNVIGLLLFSWYQYQKVVRP